MIAVFWLLLRCLSILGVLVAANVVAHSTVWGYEAQSRPSTADDGVSLSGFDYDSASALAICEQQNGATGNRVPLAKCAEFVAAKTGADSALQGARLGEHLRQLETYGQAGFKELENGSIRYYGNLKPATTPGEMSGARLVREWTPETGAKRTWLETLDQSGTVRSVRPETGGPKVHYIFDANGNYIGTR